jgi:hypothetical protein
VRVLTDENLGHQRVFQHPLFVELTQLPKLRYNKGNVEKVPRPLRFSQENGSVEGQLERVLKKSLDRSDFCRKMGQ